MLVNHPHGKESPISVPPPTGSSSPVPRLVFCISPSRGHADSILVDLLDDGIAGSDVAVLFLDPDRSVSSLVAGAPAPPPSSGALRGVVASLAGARRVVMPEVGPVIVSGGLSSLPDGEIGLPHVLEWFGVPQPEATRLAGRVMEDHFFIAVRTAYSGTADSAREIFLANKAEEVCTKLDVLRPKPGEISSEISPGRHRS